VMQQQKRIPEGTILSQIPLEAAKSYPTQYFTERNLPITIAYADANTKNEQNTLTIKLLPNGGKTATHPQIVLYIQGSYHLEKLLYLNSNAANWRTWMEVHIDTKYLLQIVNALIKAKIDLENIKT
jgi:hypothetical protein